VCVMAVTGQKTYAAYGPMGYGFGPLAHGLQ